MPAIFPDHRPCVKRKQVHPGISQVRAAEFRVARTKPQQSVTTRTVSSRLLRLLHRNRPRKQDVVLQVNVLMQVGLECR